MFSDTSFWNGKRVLVTGANGFVGGWLVRELVAHRASVVALIRDRIPAGLELHGLAGTVTSIQGDVTDSALLGRLLAEYEIDSVFHLAAQSLVPVAARNPLSTFETNIRGTWTLLEQCRVSGSAARVVVSTSDKVYGPQAGSATEETPLMGAFPYDVSKVCADVIARSYAASFGMPIAVARSANVYGGGDLNYSRIVPYAVRNVLFRQPIILRSDGSLKRDLIYVQDLVGALLSVGEALDHADIRGHAFNFGSGEPLDVLTLVDRIMNVSGKGPVKVVPSANPANGEIKEQSLDCLKANRLLGWKPRVDLDRGLRRTIEWYAAHLGQSL